MELGENIAGESRWVTHGQHQRREPPSETPGRVLAEARDAASLAARSGSHVERCRQIPADLGRCNCNFSAYYELQCWRLQDWLQLTLRWDTMLLPRVLGRANHSETNRKQLL